MASNTFAPFGFRQFAGTGSSPTYEQVTLIGGIDYNASAIFFGDPVFRLADGTIANVTPGSNILAGIFAGCKYLSTSQKRTVWSNYWPGTDVTLANQSTIEAYIINDPNSQFLVQVANSVTTDTTGLVAGKIGLNVQFAYGTGNTATGISGAYIDVNTAPAVTSTLPFRVVNVGQNLNFPPGANGYNAGPFNYAVVAFNNVETKSLTAQN